MAFLNYSPTGAQLGKLGAGVPVQHSVIADGDSGIYRTVNVIKQKIREGVAQPIIRKVLASILSMLPPNSSQTEKSKTIVKWFMSHIQYRHDDAMSWTEHGLKWIDIKKCPRVYKTCEPVEMVSDAPQILSQGYGDCDDFVVLLSALHQVGGMQTCPVIIAADPSTPNEFTHVYLVANLDGSWIPIDCVNSGNPWGWQHPSPTRREVLC